MPKSNSLSRSFKYYYNCCSFFHLVIFIIMMISRLLPIGHGFQGQIRILQNPLQLRFFGTTLTTRTRGGGLKTMVNSNSNNSNHNNSSVMINGQKKKVTTSSSSTTTSRPSPRVPASRNTGGLRRLPVVKRSTEWVQQAKRTAFRVLPDTTIKNTRNRVRKQGAERLNAITLALCVPLRDVIQGYRRELRLLHPFERVVADLTVRARKQKDGLTLHDVLNDLNEARKEILIAGKEWIAKAKTAEAARESAEIMVRCFSSLITLLKKIWLTRFCMNTICMPY
jgi:hypothetical protein